jgi:hypothetical protein
LGAGTGAGENGGTLLNTRGEDEEEEEVWTKTSEARSTSRISISPSRLGDLSDWLRTLAVREMRAGRAEMKTVMTEGSESGYPAYLLMTLKRSANSRNVSPGEGEARTVSALSLSFHPSRSKVEIKASLKEGMSDAGRIELFRSKARLEGVSLRSE